MPYYISKIVDAPFEETVARTTETLRAEGFGVLTDIDVAAVMRAKLEIDFRPYRILGGCNPQLAHHALGPEDKVGTMLPCNVVVQQAPDGRREVAAVDPSRRCRRSTIPN